MQMSLSEDSKEIQLRFEETDQPDAVLSASQGKKRITLPRSRGIHPGYTREYIKSILLP